MDAAIAPPTQPPWPRPGRRRRLLAPAGAVSLALHAGLLALALMWGRRAGPAPDAGPPALPSIEMLMVEQQGAGPPTAPPVDVPTPPTPPAVPAPPAAETPAETPPPATPPAPSAAPPTPTPPPAPDSEPLPTPPPPPPPPPPAPAQPTPAQPTLRQPPAQPARAAPSRPAAPAPPAQPAPQVNLGGTDSPSNAISLGERVLPASPDDAHRNKPPPYPQEAARRGQTGHVLLLLQVGADGRVGAVIVEHSSGFPLLDRSASDAARDWHFRPAVRDGRPVDSELPFDVVFTLE